MLEGEPDQKIKDPSVRGITFTCHKNFRKQLRIGHGIRGFLPMSPGGRIDRKRNLTFREHPERNPSRFFNALPLKIEISGDSCSSIYTWADGLQLSDQSFWSLWQTFPWAWDSGFRIDKIVMWHAVVLRQTRDPGQECIQSPRWHCIAPWETAFLGNMIK